MLRLPVSLTCLPSAARQLLPEEKTKRETAGLQGMVFGDATEVKRILETLDSAYLESEGEVDAEVPPLHEGRVLFT